MKRIMAAVLVLGATCSMANAQTTWNGGTGDWDVDGNWSSNAPDSGVDATFASFGSVANVTADAASRDLNINSGTTISIGGGNTLTVAGNLNMTSGGSRTFTGAGRLIVQGTATTGTGNFIGGGETDFVGDANFNNGGNLAISRTVTTNATTTWTGLGNMSIDGSTWTNAATGTMTRTQNGGIGQLSFDNSGQFVNDGTFIKNGGNNFQVEAGLVQGAVNGIFTNNGTLRVTEGTMTIDNVSGVNGTINFVNNGNIEVANNGSFNLEHAGTLTFNGGNLGGQGTIDDSVQMTGGSIAPGNTPGQLNINGDLAINNTTLTVEIGGTVQGTEYDFLNVSGTTDISAGPSNVVVEFVNGFAATAGETFTVLATAGFTGDTSTNLIFDFSALGGSFDVAFTDGGAGSGITFSNFTAVPEPTSLALLTLGGLGLSFVRRRRV